ncbi:MAG TPA: TauD/TfdA family dioxygenase [Pseudomonadales bacterium]|nr:TauD/TfdA family dioxygenase [Pseudomonadales bacterium]
MDEMAERDAEEGDALVAQLIAHALQPRFRHVHVRENDDIVLWDNRRTMHCTFSHPVEQVRIVQCSTIRGTVAIGRILGDEREAARAWATTIWSFAAARCSTARAANRTSPTWGCAAG